MDFTNDLGGKIASSLSDAMTVQMPALLKQFQADVQTDETTAIAGFQQAVQALIAPVLAEETKDLGTLLAGLQQFREGVFSDLNKFFGGLKVNVSFTTPPQQ